MKFARLLYLTKRAIRRLMGMTRWAASSFFSPSSDSNLDKKRLLLIYDFSSQPLSVGDILIFQEAALVLREIHGLGDVDVALVYDPRKPVVPDPAFAHILPENFLFHLSSILAAAQVNSYLGSLLLFDSHRRLEGYIADNIDDYFIWPSLGLYASREFLFYHCLDELFAKYYLERGELPSLRSRPVAATWAKQFLQQHASGVAAVSVQLRKNPATPARNSDYEAWQKFFRFCASRYPVKFIVICAPSEIDPILRDLPNVVVAKDLHTSLEQDLALIEACSMHMGPSSGPATMAMFSHKPHCMFGFDGSSIMIRCLIQEEHRLRYTFAQKTQYWIRQTETYELLLQEFEFLWKSVNSEAGI